MAAMAAAMLAGTSQAQDISAEPSYGVIQLKAGFDDDPQIIQITSGGGVDASRISSACAGFIADAPDVRLIYDAGNLPLLIGAVSQGDSTLVVNGPDGEWHCDDDSWDDGDPVLVFSHPDAGQYDIWVGSYEEGANHDAVLTISEAAALLME